jgi:hypothetical protein
MLISLFEPESKQSWIYWWKSPCPRFTWLSKHHARVRLHETQPLFEVFLKSTMDQMNAGKNNWDHFNVWPRSFLGIMTHPLWGSIVCSPRGETFIFHVCHLVVMEVLFSLEYCMFWWCIHTHIYSTLFMSFHLTSWPKTGIVLNVITLWSLQWCYVDCVHVHSIGSASLLIKLTQMWLYWTCEACTSMFPFHSLYDLDDSDCVSLSWAGYQPW